MSLRIPTTLSTSKTVMSLLFVLFSFSAISQNKKDGDIKGTVKTSDGKPAEFVNIGIKGEKGAIVDAKGNYQIRNIAPGTYTLVASYVGLGSQSRQVVVSANKTSVADFILNENNEQLKEVVVKGNLNKFAKKESEFVSKMPLENLENPQVYHVVSKELLREQLIFNVDDAINNTPGIQKMWEATGRGGDGGSYYNSRGFIVQSGLRNGIAGLVTSQIDAINLEKLEVIKGPSATLFGSKLISYGGLLNRVTKKPFDSLATEVTIAAGSYDFNRVSLDFNTPIDQGKKLMFRLNTAYNYEGTFQEQGFNRTFAVTPSLLYQPNERLSVTLDAELYQGKSIGKQMFFFYYSAEALGATSPDHLNLNYDKSYMGEGLNQKSRSINLFGQVNYKLSENWTSSTNITSSHSFSNGFSPYFYLLPDSAITKNPADVGNANYLARADQSTGDSKNQMIEIQQNFNGDFMIAGLRNRLVLGLDFFRINSDQNFYYGNFDIAPLNDPNFDFSTFNGTSMRAVYNSTTAGTYPITTKINTYSAYISNVLNITDNLNVLTALRVDRYENKGGLEGANVEPFKQTAFSPKFGVVYQPIKDKLSLFANYQNGFNNEGTYVSESGVLNAEPEQANQIEGGVKADAFGGKLTGTISYYNIKVKNLLRPGSIPNTQTQDGTQVSNGVEFDFIANPISGLNIIGGFSYNDSKMEKASDNENGRRPATASSPYLANLWASYRLPINKFRGLGAGVGFNYASENKILNSVSMGEFALPAYTILGATIFYDKAKYRIGLKANNLTNEKYYIGYTTMNPQKPRNFSVSVSYKF
ncbi:MAG: TonB-dependent receptor domain-containing protein [Sphingobacteriaceae bacterium]